MRSVMLTLNLKDRKEPAEVSERVGALQAQETPPRDLVVGGGSILKRGPRVLGIVMNPQHPAFT